ncbi:Uncharacterised protein [Bordetella pertussis]|nr:Uncharacterised protein [Bordetella pertussis]
MACLAQVKLHGNARALGVLLADGAQDGRVLVGHALRALARTGARQAQGQAHEAADRLVYGFQHAEVEIVSAGLGDAGVESQVGLWRDAAMLQLLDEGGMRLADLVQLLVGAPQGRQAGRIALQRHAHFLGAQVGPDVLHVAERLQARRGLVADECAQPLVRRHQSVGAQAQQGFAHHRPRHAEFLADFVLGRQFVAHVQAPRGDLVEDLPVQLVGQPHALAPLQVQGDAAVGVDGGGLGGLLLAGHGHS